MNSFVPNIQNKQRTEYVDVISAIMLIFMVYTHCAQIFKWTDSFIYVNSFYLFESYMVWFFFKAGMFYKEKPMKDCLISSYTRLIVPYIYWMLIGFLVLIISDYFKGQSETILYYIRTNISGCIKTGAGAANMPLWFLVTLFIFRMTYNMAQSKLPSPVICAFSFIVAFLLNCVGDFKPYWIPNSLCAIGFYSLGFILKDYKLSKSLFVVILLFYIVISVFEFSAVDFRTNNLLKGFYFLWIIQSFISVELFIYVFCKLGRGNTGLIWNIFKNIGKNSMIIYVAHWSLLIISKLLLFYL